MTDVSPALRGLRDGLLVVVVAAAGLVLGSSASDLQTIDETFARPRDITLGPPHLALSASDDLFVAKAPGNDLAPANLPERVTGLMDTPESSRLGPAPLRAATAPAATISTNSGDAWRGYLASMTALTHRQGAPLPADTNRLQSMLPQETQLASEARR
jgi:hypothetical protein